MPRILVADDDAGVRAALRTVLEYEGYDVDEAEGGEQALDTLRRRPYDVILLDVKMPRLDGMEVLTRLSNEASPTPVVMISGHADLATAVEATKRGAFDFLEKPIGRDRLLLAVRNAREVTRLGEENAELRQRFEPDEMVGSSEAMNRLRETIARAAPTGATVLITGPSGAGKELVARAIHRGSKVSRGPFIRVNCAAIPDELIESELFGHEKGSFTGAFRKQVGKFVAADGGTIFLDEIGDLSARAQAKVLRALQDGEIEPVGAARIVKVKVRVVAATNRDLAVAIQNSEFREDLFYRLNVLPIQVPQLADRGQDIPELVAYFAARYAAEIGRKGTEFNAEAMARLMSYPWPGNIRELANAVERTLILAEHDPIALSDLPQEILGAPAIEIRIPSSVPVGAPAPAAAPATSPFHPVAQPAETLAGFKERSEKDFILAKLSENSWNVSATAEAIDTPRSNLYKKIEQYGLKREAREAVAR